MSQTDTTTPAAQNGQSSGHHPVRQPETPAFTINIGALANPDAIAAGAEATGEFVGTCAQAVVRAGVGLFGGFLRGISGNGGK